MKLTKPKRRRKGESGFLDGQLLVAMPLMTDRRFARSVIYMCAHSDEGAMGLIINQRASNITAPDLLERLGIDTQLGEEGVSDDILSLSIQVGGPLKRDAVSYSTAAITSRTIQHLRLKVASASRPLSTS